MATFVVDDLRYEPLYGDFDVTVHDNRNHSGRFISQFTEEQFRSAAFQLNGYNVLNVKYALESIEYESNRNVVEKFFERPDVFPVASVSKVAIDDKTEHEGPYTMNSKEYFERMLKSPSSIHDKDTVTLKDLSCGTLHHTVQQYLLNIDTNHDSIHGYFTAYEGDQEEGLRLRLSYPKTVVTTETLTDPTKELKFLRFPENVEFAITGIFVLNSPGDKHYATELIGGETAYEKSKQKKRSGHRTRESNMFYKIKTSSDSLECIIEKISLDDNDIDTTSFENLIGADSLSILSSVQRSVCREKPLKENEIKKSKVKREKVTTCQDSNMSTHRRMKRSIEEAGSVQRSNDLVRLDATSPSLPDHFFDMSKKSLNCKDVRERFDAWELSVIRELERDTAELSSTVSIDTQSNKDMHSYFDKEHVLKFESLKSSRDDNVYAIKHSQSLDTTHAKSASSTAIQSHLISTAVEQFENLRREAGTLSNFRDEFGECVITFIESIGLRPLRPDLAREMYQYANGFIDVKNPQQSILMVAAIFIFYSQMLDMPFIVLHLGLTKFYEHRSWPIFNTEDERYEENLRSSTMYVSKVLIRTFEGKDINFSIDEKSIHERLASELKYVIQDDVQSNNLKAARARATDIDDRRVLTLESENDLRLFESTIKSVHIAEDTLLSMKRT